MGTGHYWQRLQLEGRITKQEFLTAFKNMKKDKSPGADGLPIEVYSAFYDVDLLGDIMFDLMLEICELGVSLDEGRGVIKLIE